MERGAQLELRGVAVMTTTTPGTAAHDARILRALRGAIQGLGWVSWANVRRAHREASTEDLRLQIRSAVMSGALSGRACPDRPERMRAVRILAAETH